MQAKGGSYDQRIVGTATGTSHVLALHTNSVERTRVTELGFMGIGTNASVSGLLVCGSTPTVGITYSAGVHLGFDSTSGSTNNTLLSLVGGTSTGSGTIAWRKPGCANKLHQSVEAGI